MFGRLVRWLRGRSADGRGAPEPAAARERPPPPVPGDGVAGMPYRSPGPEPAAEEEPPWYERWFALHLLPPGVLASVEVYALRRIVPMIYMATNDIVFVHAGSTCLLEHEGCVPAPAERGPLAGHEYRPGRSFVPAPGDRRRLERVPTVVTRLLPFQVKDGEAVRRRDEPTDRRVDLMSALAPEVWRILHDGGGDPTALASLLALLDMLAHFDGHHGGEVELLARDGMHRESKVQVGLGALGAFLCGARVSAELRARVAERLGAGIAAGDAPDGLRVHVLIDKHESLTSSSGHLARLCLGTLTASPAGFVYEDEVLWVEFVAGMEYS